MLPSIGQIITRTWELYTKNIKKMSSYTALLVFVPIIFTIINSYVLLRMVNGMVAVGPDSKRVGLFLVLGAIMSVISYIVSLWIAMGFFRAIKNIHKNKPILSVRQELLHAWRLLPAGIWVSILLILLMLLITGPFYAAALVTQEWAYMLFALPGVIVYLWYTFSLYEVALDGERGLQAMKKSKALVTGRWWPVFFRLMGPTLFFIVIYLLAQVTLELIVSFTTALFSNAVLLFIIKLLVFLAYLAITFIFVPLVTIIPTILFLEMDKKKVELA